MFLHLHLSYRTSASFTQLKNLTVGAPHETEMDAVGYLYPSPGKKKKAAWRASCFWLRSYSAQPI